ncbi:MAG: hypothetical protein XD85_0062 [Parcubacteria bacterium 34_609]|nr:MAG: hypothetical protein XD85_0062 [Parcubacteria bacterium 34_609]KUK99443.1 MAG: hypothetical protein XE08_0036 [Parcubacteria bacterium 32_520]
MNEEQKDTSLKIPLDGVFKKFEKHIDKKTNSRIVFSAKFGMGKTYFLKEFFKEHKDQYEVFHLFPINYQICSNDDIFDFLKYDIVVELSKKNKDVFGKSDYSNFIDLQRLFFIWGKNNFKDIFKTGVSYIPKLGRPLVDTIELLENFSEFKKNIEAGEKEFVDNFIKNNKGKDIQETDYLSELLKRKIEKQKESKESVLILDDLDRIDPEHVFRILNVFSSYFDLEDRGLSNKFGFDKVIIVMDVKNIENIFSHRYGKNVDFSGYFDKFFIEEIFFFENEDAILSALDGIISNFKVGEDSNLKESLNNEASFLTIIIKNLLLDFIKKDPAKTLNLRKILKVCKYNFPALGIKYQEANSREYAILQFVHISISLFISIFDANVEKTLKALEDLKSVDFENQKQNRGYEVFSYWILKRICKKKFTPTKENPWIEWKEYSILISNRESIVEKVIINRKTKNKEIDISVLFIDLLINYIKKGYYENKIDPFSL